MGTRTQILLYQTVMGESATQDPDIQEVLERHAQRFQGLPETEQGRLRAELRTLQEADIFSMGTIAKSMWHVLVHEQPALLLGWFCFGFLMCMLLLLRFEGGVAAAWVVAFLAAAHIFISYQGATMQPFTAEEALYPSEEHVVAEYLGAPLGETLSEQREQLLQGWRSYLVVEWAKQKPASDPTAFAQQVEDGEFAFNLALLQAKKHDVENPLRTTSEPFLFSFLFLSWNLFFALYIRKRAA